MNMLPPLVCGAATPLLSVEVLLAQLFAITAADDERGMNTILSLLRADTLTALLALAAGEVSGEFPCHSTV